ncbi:MAG: alpha-N-arabinofuranosidase [Melioribacteraceae bacterium]
MKKRIQICLLIMFSALSLYAQEVVTKISLDAGNNKTVIDKNIYGNFSEHLGHCIYGGIWVGENSPIPNTRGIRNDVVEALKKIKLPVLRWPGGCFADEYHWMDGIGPRDKRPKMINTHWGGVVEDNSFGTHEFLDLCEQIGAEPYICGNLGSGSVEEMSKWVEYITFDGESPMANLRKQNGREKPWSVKFWGVGNENWGCGGNMSAAFYADQYKRYATYTRNYGKNRLYKIAGGPNSDDYEWTETLMKNVGGWLMQGLSLHYYTVPKTWGDKGSATEFNEEEYFATMKKTLFMEEMVTKHSEVMDKYDPEKRIGLLVDEWGNWFNVEKGTNPGFLYQQNSLRDAITAATNLNIFNNHADRVKMSNIAQMVNVLQAVILTDGPKMVLTPTYHVFDLFKVHQNAKLIPNKIETTDYTFGDKKVPAVNCSASQDESGKIHISLTNVNPNKVEKVVIQLNGIEAKNVAAQVLTSKLINDYNSFEKPSTVAVGSFSNFKVGKENLEVELPSKSVVILELITK